MDGKLKSPHSTSARPRPLSPNIQIYRPQLTSIRTGPARYSGQVLADFLDGLIRGTVTDQEVLHLPDPELIIRESS